jgi:hypothetical protein
MLLLVLLATKCRISSLLCKITGLSRGLYAKSKKKLLCDWRFTANQFVLASGPLRPTTRILFFNWTLAANGHYVTFSPTRGWACRLQLLLALASTVILRSESRGTQDRILPSQIRDSSYLEGQVPVFIFPRNWVAQFYPQALGSLSVASYDTQGYGGGIRTHLYAGCIPSVCMLTSGAYINSVRTSQETHYVSATKTNRLMLFRGK